MECGGDLFRNAILFAAAIAACGCTHLAPTGALVQGEPPPDLAMFFARYEGDKVCETQPANLRMPTVARAPGDPRPLATSTCAPVFPAALQDRGYQADCTVRFTLREDGAASTVGADCALFDGDFANADWQVFAKAAFEGMADRAVSRWRFAPAPDTAADALFVQPIRFMLAD